jgi:hypothetical protein
LVVVLIAVHFASAAFSAALARQRSRVLPVNAAHPVGAAVGRPVVAVGFGAGVVTVGVAPAAGVSADPSAAVATGAACVGLGLEDAAGVGSGAGGVTGVVGVGSGAGVVIGGVGSEPGAVTTSVADEPAGVEAGPTALAAVSSTRIVEPASAAVGV